MNCAVARSAPALRADTVHDHYCTGPSLQAEKEISYLKNENPMSEPMKSCAIIGGLLLAMK